MIVLDERIIAIWFFPIDDDSDFMAGLSWETEEMAKAGKGNVNLIYRFRYYDKERGDPFTGNDKKNWYSGVIATEDKEGTLTGVRECIRVMADVKGQIAEEILNTDGMDQVMRDMEAKSWAHFKIEPLGEVAQA